MIRGPVKSRLVIVLQSACIQWRLGRKKLSGLVLSRKMTLAPHTRRHGSAQVVDGCAAHAVVGRGCQGAGEFREQRQRVTRTAAPSQRPSGSESWPNAKTAKLQACDLCSQRYPSEDNAPSLNAPAEGERRLCEGNFPCRVRVL